MLQHVSGIDGSNAAVGIRKPVAHVKPEIDFVPRVGVHVDEPGKIIWPASKMKMDRAAIGAADSG